MASMKTVTREWLDENKTSRGGWTNAQLVQLGEPWPPRKGWMNRALGKEISDDAAAEFARLSRYRQKKEERKAIRSANRRGNRAEKVAALERKLAKGNNWSPKHVVSDDFLRSYEWRKVRMVALKKFGARCQCCGASPENGVMIHVDHIKPRRLFPHLALDVDNLQVLCEVCNHGKGNWDQTDWRPEEVDTNVVSILRDIAKNG